MKKCYNNKEEINYVLSCLIMLCKEPKALSFI